MQNHTERSASDIRIAAFKKAILKNRVMTDAKMREFLKCSVATYQREVGHYIASLPNLIREVQYNLLGFESDVNKLILEHEKEKLSA